MIVLRQSERGIVVRLRPSIVQPQAYAALMYYLVDRKPQRIAVQHLQDTWKNELFGRVELAIARITALIQNATIAQRKDICKRDLSIARLASSDPFLHLLQGWTHKPRWSQLANMISTAGACTSGRYFLFERDSSQGTFVYRGLGPGAPEWARLCMQPGLRLRHGHDWQFSQFCTDTFKVASDACQPKLDEVDAIITWPSFGPLRRRYRRVLLPFRDPARRNWLLSATIEDATINLLHAAA